MVKKILLKISGMHCSSCALDIDATLEDTEGVIESNTSYAKSECKVEFDSDKVSDTQIVETVKKSRYTAVTVQ